MNPIEVGDVTPCIYNLEEELEEFHFSVWE